MVAARLRTRRPAVEAGAPRRVGCSNPGGTTNDDEHQYDGDGKRMRSKLAGASDWTNFVHDELTGEVLMEYTLVGGTFTIKAVNTWGLGLISTNREGTKRYFHFDALGSTRALTDSSETVTDTYEYNAFGVVESSSGTSVNPYRYVGQYGYYDDGAMGSSSGLLLLGVRYYSPAHGRFWSWDPVPNLNLYAYVNNSATMAIDPSGLFPKWFCAIICAGPCAGTGGSLCLQCLSLCDAASDIDELRKELDKLMGRRKRSLNPTAIGDCLDAPGYGAVFESNCIQCCGRLDPDDTSRFRDYCECMCRYTRSVYKPAPSEKRGKERKDPCGAMPEPPPLSRATGP